VLGFLLPDSFFNIATFQDARLKAFAYTIKRLIDYDKPFKGLVTKAQAIILSKETPQGDYTIVCQINQKTHQRTVSSFTSNPKKIMNFWIDENASAVIHHVYKLPHLTLDKNATWGLGIVTGNNTKYTKNKPSDGYMPVYKGSDILTDGLKPPSVYIPNDLSLYQQIAPKQLYEAKIKIIYKFISSNLGFFCDTEQQYILNSANMLILKKKFPTTREQFCALFNSDFMNWLFQSLFNTHKVLRGDLETLPIHIDYFKTHPIFDENTFLAYFNIEKIKNVNYQYKLY
jgi:site-specific DNA-methyltransferase (adenine-specific)